jgi:hypothetical protein
VGETLILFQSAEGDTVFNPFRRKKSIGLVGALRPNPLGAPSSRARDGSRVTVENLRNRCGYSVVLWDKEDPIAATEYISIREVVRAYEETVSSRPREEWEETDVPDDVWDPR